MTKKIINITLNIALFLLPIVIIPLSIKPKKYNEPKIILIYICGIILLACLLFLLIKNKKLKLDKSDIFILIFILLVYVSTCFSVDLEVSIFGTKNRYEGALTFTFYFLVYYCTKYYFKFHYSLIDISLIVILFASTLGILQYHDFPVIGDLFLSPVAGRSFASSTFGNRNFFGSFISITLPYLMCLYIFYKEKIYLFVASVNFYALLISLTRSAWLAFGIFSLIGIIYIIKQKDKEMLKRAGILVLIFSVLFLIFFISYSDSFLQKIKMTITDVENLAEAQTLPNKVSEENTQEVNNSIIISEKKTNRVATGRLLIWKVAIDLTLKYPLFGCGTDAFFEELYENDRSYLLRELYPALNGVPDKAHNEFLQISATLGIPALIVYLIFLFLTLKYLLKSNLKENKPAFIVFLCLISYLTQAFFNISTIGVAPIFYFLLGLSYTLKKENA